MSDDDKKSPGTGPTPEELQRSFQEFFGKMGNVQWVMPGMGPEVEDDEPEVPDTPPADSVFEFNYIPRDIKAHLDRFVIRQDEAKKALSIAVCDHYNHAKYLRSLENEHGKLPEGVELQKQNVKKCHGHRCKSDYVWAYIRQTYEGDHYYACIWGQANIDIYT